MALMFLQERRMVRSVWFRTIDEQTIKSNYTLSLILDIVENISIKKVFTKLNLQWRYNNIQTKEGNEQKAAFIILKGLFKLTVIFFRLTNSLVMFEIMINKILQNLINTREIASFINNVIVGMEVSWYA